MEAMNRILRYLKMTPGRGLLYKKAHTKDVEVFLDANWTSDVLNRRSISRYCSYIWGNLVTWSKKQSIVSRSSVEAEFRSLALCICEEIWIQKLLKELGITIEKPIKMFFDNHATKLCEEPCGS